MIKYKVEAPVGNIVVPNKPITEEELRNFVVQIVQDANENAVWLEKAAKDPIESVVEWLQNAGYTVDKVQ